MKNVCHLIFQSYVAKLPRKGKLREGVGREVADWGVGQELHHLKISEKVRFSKKKVGMKVSSLLFKCEWNNNMGNWTWN